ncbi:MAG: hypothetical protein HYX62_08550 [Gammaproteobacteria bacterium]|nr:hypothetical protein [Gammaproteobacteria bacterium]
MFPLDANPQLTAQGCYDYWWVTGSYEWRWKYYLLYSWNSLRGTTSTKYGTSTGPCDIPLTVDWIQVKGNNRGGEFNAVINNTAYNTSYVEAYDKVTGSGGSAKVCGTRTEHIANKSGVQWATYGAAGC